MEIGENTIILTFTDSGKKLICMGWSPLDIKNPSGGSVIGDEPFDLISSCFREIASAYQRDWDRKPTLRELVGTVQQVLEAQLQDHTSDGESAELTALDFKTKKIPKRQKYAKGDVLKAIAANGQPVYARIFDPELHPKMAGRGTLGLLSGCMTLWQWIRPISMLLSAAR